MNQPTAAAPLSTPTRTIDLIVYPGFKALEAIGPMSVFEYANLHLRRQNRPAGYDVRVASTAIGAVQSDTLMAVQATKAISALALPDDAIIVGSREIASALQAMPALVEWVAIAAAGNVRRLAALCSGTFFLAAAGILDGKRATTHWAVAAQLQQQYPAILVDIDAIFVQAGNIWTSAGVTAGIDLALAFVEEDFGRELALDVATEMVVYLKRPGGQSQFSTHLQSQKTALPTIRQIQRWILANLREKLSIAMLAQKAHMSERNFTRVFHQEVGQSTLEFIEAARFEQARQLLADVSLPLKAVAAQSGFANDEHMRRVFGRRVGISPKVYRERFATTGVHARLPGAV